MEMRARSFTSQTRFKMTKEKTYANHEKGNPSLRVGPSALRQDDKLLGKMRPEGVSERRPTRLNHG